MQQLQMNLIVIRKYANFLLTTKEIKTLKLDIGCLRKYRRCCP